MSIKCVSLLITSKSIVNNNNNNDNDIVMIIITININMWRSGMVVTTSTQIQSTQTV